MSTKAQRGIKRTCQNPECGSRFYDLNRDPIVCPICDSVYELAVSALPPGAQAVAAEQEQTLRKPAKKPAYDIAAEAKPDDAPETEGDEDLAVIEGEEAPPTDDDETFLEEEEEDSADMSNIIGGPVAETDEST